MNTDGEKRTDGRDLMPVIVIFIFAIVMTLVVIALRSMIREKEMNSGNAEFSELHQNAGRFMDTGDHLLSEKKYAEAEKAFAAALKLLEQAGMEDPAVWIPVETRLAETAEKRGDATAVRNHLARLGYLLNTLLQELREKHLRAGTASTTPELPRHGTESRTEPDPGKAPKKGDGGK